MGYLLTAGMRRLLAAVAILLGVGIGLILLPALKLTDWLTALTALLIVVTAAPYPIRTFVFTPILEMRVPEQKDVRKPILGVPAVKSRACLYVRTESVQRYGFLRLEVLNHGLVAAKDCIVAVRVVKRPRKQVQGRVIEAEAPSREFDYFRQITWSLDAEKYRCTINPGTRQLVDLVIQPIGVVGRWEQEEIWGRWCGNTQYRYWKPENGRPAKINVY